VKQRKIKNIKMGSKNTTYYGKKINLKNGESEGL